MRALVGMTVLAMTLTISACGDDDDDSSAEATEQEASGTAAADIPDIEGQTVDEATTTLEDAGLTLRVIQRDGEDLPVTMDFVENRVNVAVETQDDGSEVVTGVVSTG